MQDCRKVSIVAPLLPHPDDPVTGLGELEVVGFVARGSDCRRTHFNYAKKLRMVH